MTILDEGGTFEGGEEGGGDVAAERKGEASEQGE